MPTNSAKRRYRALNRDQLNISQMIFGFLNKHDAKIAAQNYVVFEFSARHDMSQSTRVANVITFSVPPTKQCSMILLDLVLFGSV